MFNNILSMIGGFQLWYSMNMEASESKWVNPHGICYGVYSLRLGVIHNSYIHQMYLNLINFNDASLIKIKSDYKVYMEAYRVEWYNYIEQ